LGIPTDKDQPGSFNLRVDRKRADFWETPGRWHETSALGFGINMKIAQPPLEEIAVELIREEYKFEDLPFRDFLSPVHLD